MVYPLLNRMGAQTRHVPQARTLYWVAKSSRASLMPSRGRVVVPNIAARALATYLIPGCVGRGVRLGSESSSVVVGGVWKSGNLEIWDFGNLEIWGPGNPEILRFGDLEIQNFGIQKIKKIKSLKNQIRSAQNVGKVWISRKKILPALFGAI